MPCEMSGSMVSLTRRAVQLATCLAAVLVVPPHRVMPQSPSPDARSRYALLVGISDYPGTEQDLGGGPLNDVQLMRTALIDFFDFPPGNILVLTDAEATRTSIISSFVSHLGKADSGGVALFFYSGHGSQVANVGADDEGDGLDEIIVVRDSAADRFGYLIDEELGMLARLIRANRMLFILDNCYSGTGTRGAGKQPNLSALGVDLREKDQLVPDLRPSRRSVDPKRIPSHVLATMLLNAPGPLESVDPSATPPDSPILLSASAENELSYNTPVPLDDGRVVKVGLFTLALYGALARGRGAEVSFDDLIAEMRLFTRRVAAILQTSPQTPQAEGARSSLRMSEFLK